METNPAGGCCPPASFRPPQELHLKQQQQRGSGKRCFLSGSSHASSTMKLRSANLSSYLREPGGGAGLWRAGCGLTSSAAATALPLPQHVAAVRTKNTTNACLTAAAVSAPPASRRSEGSSGLEVQEVTCREPRLRGWNTLRMNSCSFAGIQASPRRHAHLDQRLLLLRWCLDSSSNLLMRPAFRLGCPRSRRSAEMLSWVHECTRAVLPRARGGLIRRREPEWDWLRVARPTQVLDESTVLCGPIYSVPSGA